MVSPEGVISNDEVTAQSQDQLNSTFDALEADTEVPPGINAAMAARICDILRAMGHVRTVGPDEVQAATEELVG